jgi:acetyl esterase/lipase
MGGSHPTAPGTGSVLPIWPGPAPGSESWAWHEQESLVEGDRMVRNVSRPTLEAFVPDGPRNGTAVIVAPGGAFHVLSIDFEGTDLARWLAARGVTAFVLRYRLRHTPERDDEMARFRAELDRHLLATTHTMGLPARLGPETEAARLLGEEDGRQAIRVVRRQAAEWAVDPGRIGIVGFSAGAAVAVAAALVHDADSRPDFAAPIYVPAPDPISVPADAPPLFLALAVDDPLIPATHGVSVWRAWQAAGRDAELHVFRNGGHGFGMKRLGHASDAWIDLFEGWLDGLGLLGR